MPKKKPVKPKLKPHWAGEETETEHWAGRIDRDILSAIKSHAHANRRTIGGQINVALDEWLKSFTSDGMQKLLKRPSPIPVLEGTSEPPKRIQAQAKSKTPPVPVDKLEEIANSEEGWEGSDPSTLLAHTKVT
ncbi:MAG TPA: hypothetical protein VJY15_06240 [Candidatus Acidoferrum sp.]|nr:hypothetical protein [Candidatus Acidoferrum sp.]